MYTWQLVCLGYPEVRSILQPLTNTTLSLLRALGRQGLLDGGGRGGGGSELRKWGDVKWQTPGETPTGDVIKLRRTFFQSPSRGNQTLDFHTLAEDMHTA